MNRTYNKFIGLIPLILIVFATTLVIYICNENGIISSLKEKRNELNNAPKGLNISKCLNTTGITYSNPTTVSEDYGLSMKISSDKKSITLIIDWHKFGPVSTSSSWTDKIQKVKILGFEKEIKSVFVGDVGQDSTGITLFYLMEDGTVEYTRMFVQKFDNNVSHYEINYTYEYASDGSITGTYFKTEGALSEVSNVIKFYIVDQSNGQTGGKTTIGATNDGSFYDLGTSLSKKK